MTRLGKRLVLCTLVSAAVMAMGAPALADHLEVEASVPDSVAPGDVIDLEVVVRTEDSGELVPGATIVLFREAYFLGVSGDVEIARAITDDNGVAIVHFRARAGTSEQVIVASVLVGEEAFESHPLPVVTVGSGPQIVSADAGLRIPGFGVWILIALVITIWAIIQFALLGPVEVARLAHESVSDTDKEATP